MLARMNSKIELKRVEFIPKVPEAGILYVSERFQVAVHSCPCGCGNKIVTPIGPSEWEFTEEGGKPSLYPSVGNWQIPCRSHYWITDGEIQWSYQWSEKMIKAGRRKDKAKLEKHLRQKARAQSKSFWKRIQHWILGKG